jgi:hypothetical protein
MELMLQVCLGTDQAQQRLASAFCVEVSQRQQSRRELS